LEEKLLRIPNIKVTPPGPNAQEYVELDRKYISKGSGVKLLPLVPEHDEGATTVSPTFTASFATMHRA